MKKILIIPICILMLAISGCAAMFHGTSQQIHIRSNMPDTELFVNEQYIGKGNSVIAFKKNKNYVITARKEGCNAVSIPASKSFDAISLLGILLDFGIISILIVDGLGTGAITQFDQTSYIIDPQCKS